MGEREESTLSPLIVAAGALAGGDLLGLWAGGATPDADSPVPVSAIEAVAIVAGLLAASWIVLGLHARSRRSHTAGAALAAAPAVLLIAVSGFAIGRNAGATALRTCARELRGGENLAARGILLDPVPARAARERGRPVTVRLASAVLAHGGRRCNVSRLRARAWPSEVRVSAGAAVAISGSWRSYPRPGSLPTTPDRLGYLQGELLAVDGVGRSIEGSSISTQFARFAARFREQAGLRLDESLAPDVVGTGKALVLADRASLDRGVRGRFTDAGIGHLLAISGLHIGALAGGLLWCLGLCTRSRRRYPIAVLATGAYVLLIGAPPSAARAFLLFAGYAATRLRGAPASLGDLSGLAAVIALLADPLVLLHPSFQLSFAGFTGIIAGRATADRLLGRIGSGSHRLLMRRWRLSVIALSASFAAFLFTAPFAAAHFGRIVPAAVFSSFLGSALVALALPALILSLALPGWLAGWTGAAATSALRLLDALATRFAALPLHWDAPPLEVAWWLVLAAILVAWGFLRVRRRIAAIFVASGACIAWIVMPGALRWLDRGDASVCTLDVGQGDAAAIRTSRGRWILIDSGPGPRFLAGSSTSGRIRSDPRYGDAGVTAVVPFLQARGVREIELFVLSHPHLDHFGGSAAVFDAFRVRRVLDPGFVEPSPAYLAFLDRVEEEGASWLAARAGLRARIDEIDLLVLWPPEGGVDGGANEHSVVFRMRAPGLSYLNTGDAPIAVEAAILAEWPADSLSAQLLKLGHHGSRTSTSLAWLRAVRPAITVISAGRGNTHGHPHPVTLARLDSARIPTVWRTDEHGGLCVETREGGSWQVGLSP